MTSWDFRRNHPFQGASVTFTPVDASVGDRGWLNGHRPNGSRYLYGRQLVGTISDVWIQNLSPSDPAGTPPVTLIRVEELFDPVVAAYTHQFDYIITLEELDAVALPDRDREGQF